MSQNIFIGSISFGLQGTRYGFYEIREYEFGNDVRDIDWNVTARYSKLFVKVFEKEHELIIILLIDVSGSQKFGTQGMIKKI